MRITDTKKNNFPPPHQLNAEKQENFSTKIKVSGKFHIFLLYENTGKIPSNRVPFHRKNVWSLRFFIRNARTRDAGYFVSLPHENPLTINCCCCLSTIFLYKFYIIFVFSVGKNLYK